MYSFESTVRYSEIDSSMQLDFKSIINYFQDCSSFHSEAVGAGFSFLTTRERIWLMSSWQIEVTRFPRFNEKITIETWPTAFKGLYGYRNFLIRSQSGDVEVAASSIWVHMDTRLQRPAKIEPEDAAPYPPEPPYPMPPHERKIKLPDTFLEELPFAVSVTQLDTNRHVNNGQYVAMAEQYLPAGLPVKKMRADYRKSAVLGDTIYPLVHSAKDSCTIVLADKEKAPYAIVEFRTN